MDEFLKNLRNLLGLGERQEATNEEQGAEEQPVDSSRRLPNIFDGAVPNIFNIRIDPKTSDAARRTDLYASPDDAKYIDPVLAMGADSLSSLLKEYYDANSWESREQAANRIREKAQELDPNQQSTALNNWLNYFNGGHKGIMSGLENIDFDSFTRELSRPLDDARKRFIRRI